MSSSVDRVVRAAEVKSSHRVNGRSEESSPLDVELRMAKAQMGAAFESAIGDTPDKAFGHEGLVSGLKSGEKVPDYLARIARDKGARRRFALALLEDDTDVIVTTTVTIPQAKRKVG